MEVGEPVGPQGKPASARSPAAVGIATAASPLGGQLLRGGVPGRQRWGVSPPSPNGFFSHTDKKMALLHGSLIVSENEF